MNAVADYFDSLTTELGAAWNRFWFTPADPTLVCLLRWLTGVMACWFLLSFATDLTTWFGVDGLLPIQTVRQLTEEDGGEWNRRVSYLNLSDDSRFLIAVHVAGIAVAMAFTVGLATRITNIATLAIVLSYVHRGPVLVGQFESVLTLMLFYLCIAPCQRKFSMDRWLKKRRKPDTKSVEPRDDGPSVSANISQRLMQVHIAALYILLGLTKLGGSDVWWNGEAMWWLIAHTESRLIDLTSLHRYPYLVNFWTHAVVSFELLFGVLIWNRLARPLLLGLAVIHWVLLGLVTGLLSYSAMMLVANLSFAACNSIRGTAREQSPATESASNR